MMVRNVTDDEMEIALKNVNEIFKDNVVFNRYDWTGNKLNFTLKVKSSKGEGARRSQQGKRMASACWHVHGEFFDALFLINPKAVIRAGRKVITKDAGNWEDWNIGSIMQPMMYSEACDCNR